MTDILQVQNVTVATSVLTAINCEVFDDMIEAGTAHDLQGMY